MAKTHIKRRSPAAPGSIPDVLEMFSREIRFYQEVAPEVGVRVPDCVRAEVAADGSTRLELEDLSSWRDGADPEAAATTLRVLHQRWDEGVAADRWPWLVRNDASALVSRLFRSNWETGRSRDDITPSIRDYGDRLAQRVMDIEPQAGTCGPVTLTHGDASALNMKTSVTGQVALLDWEDVGLGPGITDLAWFLISSVDPSDWELTVSAYGRPTELIKALPAASIQAILSLFDHPIGSDEARGWIARLDHAARQTWD